jgi:signal transduction histidine kinase
MGSDRATAEALLEELDGADTMVVTTAVRQCTERLKSGDWEPALLGALTERLLKLSTDVSPRPRQAVAESLAYLGDDVYGVLYERLIKDASQYVRYAAASAPPRRAALRRAALQEEEHEGRVVSLYAQLDARSRRLTRTISAYENEYYVRRMNHEAANLDVPILASLDRLDELTNRHPEVAHLRDLLEQEREIHREARRNAGTDEPEYRRENLRALVESQAQELGARADVDLSGIDRRIELEADASSLRRAFRNILKNAVEAYAEMPGAKPRVAVSARESGTDAVLIFVDEGCGMNEEQMQRAFVPFGSSKPGGTGFGLFIARKVARQIHGGDLVLSSVVGKGTTVTMTLPLRQETTAPKRRRRR